MVQQPFRPFRPSQSNFVQQKQPNKGVKSGYEFQTLPKPTNLSNSAVLRLLSEDEPRLRRVIWPPPSPPLVETENQEDNNNTPSPQRHLSKPSTPTRAFTPPPTTITLRPEPPISQLPPPVFVSQPATATMQGGKHLRGDLKWPPESYKKQAEIENEARIALAKGPVFRPRRVQKDYSSFFAQHSLTNNYPGYRVPPGTQHYIEEGTSNL
ncbi:hypothetical protein M8J77_014121 [Diaphorina citri]|nr:hypothetical protein M8J77_014121 [Diaphorina citri]